MLMKSRIISKNCVSLMVLLGVLLLPNVYAQKDHGNKNGLLIPEDVAMVEMQKRNAVLPTVRRRALEHSITELVKSMNGTWELVYRMVSNRETGDKLIIVPTTGTMTFHLESHGTHASGDFLVIEEGLGNRVISPDVGTDEPFALGSYNRVFFEAGFEGGMPTGLSMNSFVPREEHIVISEQIMGEILGSYGIYREPIFYRQTSEDLTKYMAVPNERSRMHFVAKNVFLAPGSENKDSVDPYDIIKLSGDVMVLGISSKGIVDMWQKTSSTVQVHGHPLNSYWEELKASKHLSNPTFKKSE